MDNPRLHIYKFFKTNMSKIPKHLKYTAEHEWIRDDGDGIFCIGITDYAQAQLGDLVFVDLPDVTTIFERGEECAVVESVKSASDVYCPLSGEVVDSNTALENNPEFINQDPYGEGWMFKLKVANLEDDEGELLDPNAYADLVATEAH
jgi:glycine cleavage system H protein